MHVHEWGNEQREREISRLPSEWGVQLGARSQEPETTNEPKSRVSH